MKVFQQDFFYPISTAADITAFKANFVPGNDSKPMIEQTQNWRSFNHAYNTDALVEPEGFTWNEAQGAYLV